MPATQSTQSTQQQQQQQQDQRCALVTGSSNGIGEAIVRALAKLNYKLVVTGRSESDIRRVAGACAELSPSRSRPLEVPADLEREQDVRQLFAASLAHFGGRLDLLVNNAGFSKTIPFEDNAEANWQNYARTLQVNLNSAVLLTLLAAGPLRETARARRAAPPHQAQPTSVVNISSIAAQHPLEDFAYCVSKAGLSMLGKCMASRLGPLVRVNSLEPGPVETKIVERGGLSLDQFRAFSEQMSPLGRIGQAHEIADAVVFLADPERASLITGAQLTIDGGLMCASIKF